ncbi:hypothetical protein MPSEU_000556100 [Mayamaea pseudoterrestris]|nr:hypothetical protein MPSEU_000556100 [Mayamaea pseudoterrestris]
MSGAAETATSCSSRKHDDCNDDVASSATAMDLDTSAPDATETTMTAVENPHDLLGKCDERFVSCIAVNDPTPPAFFNDLMKLQSTFTLDANAETRDVTIPAKTPCIPCDLLMNHAVIYWLESAERLVEERRRNMQAATASFEASLRNATATTNNAMATQNTSAAAATNFACSPASWLRRLFLQVGLRLHFYATHGEAFLQAYDIQFNISSSCKKKMNNKSKNKKKTARKIKTSKLTKNIASAVSPRQLLLDDLISLLSLATFCLTPKRTILPLTAEIDADGSAAVASTSPTTVVDNIKVDSNNNIINDNVSSAPPSSNVASANAAQDVMSPESLWEFLTHCMEQALPTAKSVAVASLVQELYDHFELQNPLAAAADNDGKLSPLKRTRKTTRERNAANGTTESVSMSASVASATKSTTSSSNADAATIDDMSSHASLLRLESQKAPDFNNNNIKKKANPLLQGSTKRFTGSHFHTDLSSHAFQQVVTAQSKATLAKSMTGAPTRFAAAARSQHPASRQSQQHETSYNSASSKARGGGTTNTAAFTHVHHNKAPLPRNILAPATPCKPRSKPRNDFVVAETPQRK